VSTDISIYERDVWIVSYLSASPPDKRTIRDIWEAAKEPRRQTSDVIRQLGGLGETASLPTYHRTVGKLAARGQLEMGEPLSDGTATYCVTPLVSSLTPLSQTELNEALWELGPTQALAMYVDAVEQFEGMSADVLRRAAEGLGREDPRKLILQMLQDLARELDEDIADLRDPDTGEDSHRRRLARRLTDFARFVHGELGLHPAVWTVPTVEDAEERGMLPDLAIIDGCVTPPDWAPVEEELAQHVFGKTFIEYAEIPPDPPGEPELVVAGTDGSSHVGLVRGMPASAYQDEDRLLLTFNNSAGYVEVPPSYPTKYQTPYHGVPVTRAALEDPHHKGMIISRPWFQDLDEGEFEHMKKSALDVVQFRIDEALLAGSALPYGSSPVSGGPALPKPNLLIRDGAVSPQGRELQNYRNPTEYGEVVQEGIRLSYRILRLVMDSERRVFAGAVKSTQLRTFSRILNWYIKRGSTARYGQPLDPNWDLARMGLISDSIAMTRVLAAMPELARKSQYYRTCVIVRPFTAMATSLFRVSRGHDPEDWYNYFEEKSAEEVASYHRHGGSRPFFLGRDIREDEYVRMCVYGDYGMFYYGKPGGSPQITFPRFEFLDSIRMLRETKRVARVQRTVELIMRGVHRTKWTLDQEHNMMTNRRMPKLVPSVVYEAHEVCKVLGHKLVSELQQAIAASLSQMKAMRGAAVPRIDIEPVSMTKYKQYIARMKRNLVEWGTPVGDATGGRCGAQRHGSGESASRTA
jgi:hypothetical protein